MSRKSRKEQSLAYTVCLTVLPSITLQYENMSSQRKLNYLQAGAHWHTDQKAQTHTHAHTKAHRIPENHGPPGVVCFIFPSSATHHHAINPPTTRRASWTNHHGDQHHEGASHTIAPRLFLISQISEIGGCKYSINLNLDVTPPPLLPPSPIPSPACQLPQTCMFLNINTREAGNRRILVCSVSLPPPLSRCLSPLTSSLTIRPRRVVTADLVGHGAVEHRT